MGDGATSKTASHAAAAGLDSMRARSGSPAMEVTWTMAEDDCPEGARLGSQSGPDVAHRPHRPAADPPLDVNARVLQESPRGRSW